jgi:PAS domain S-box-containing protein
MSQGVVRLDQSETVVSANRAALEYLSLTEERILGREVWGVLEESTKEQFSPLFRPWPLTGERRRSTIVLQEGNTVLRAELIAPKGRASDVLTLFLTDVTAEHAVSENLQRRERGYRSIVESTTDLLWTVDTNNNITYISPGTLRFTGYSAAEYESGGIRLLLGAASDQEAEEILSEAQARSSRGESYQFEKKLPIKRDGKAWSLIRVSPLLDEDGNCHGVEFLATNIDRRKKAEDKLKRAVVERETLIREIHHRVKNSVQLIVSMIRLRLGSHPDAGVQAIAEGLENRIRIIAGVYAQLYEYKSLDRLEGSTLIEQSVALALDQMPSFEVEYRSDPFVLSLDSAIPIAMLVRELVRNVAYHVYPFVESARLRISSAIRDSELELAFTDNGPGMSAEKIENPESLGFVIAESCATQLKGKLSCKCHNGKGTTITLRCPYEVPPPMEENGTP